MAKSRMEHGVQNQPLILMDPSTLQYWLTHFVLEVRKKNGSSTLLILYTIWCVVSCATCDKVENQKLKDASFEDFRASLDAEMKQLQSTGVGSKQKQAESLTLEEEELWTKKV